MKKSLPIVAATVALLLALTGCGASVSVEEKPKADTGTSQESEPQEESTPTPPPAPEEGTLANPFPVGSALVATDGGGNELYSLTATITNGDATAAIIEANQFNELPAAGMKYITVNLTFTGINDTKPVSPSMESYDFKISNPDGVLFTQASVVSSGTSMYESSELYAGQTFTGEVVFEVPADQGVFYLTTLGAYLAL